MAQAEEKCYRTLMVHVMNIIRHSLILVLGIALYSAPHVSAQEPIPLEVERVEDLDFGLFSISGNRGRITINRNNGTRTGNGSVTFFDNDFSRAEFLITGEPNTRIRITAPSGILLSRNGGDTIEVNNLRADTGNNARIGDDGTLTVFFGGTLVANGTTPAGRYQAPFDIQVEER